MMKKKSLPILLCSLFLLSSCDKLYTDIEKYDEYLDKLVKADTFMPKLDTLSNYESMDLYFLYDNIILGGSINLKLSYPDSYYEEEKNSVLNRYKFLTSPVKTGLSKYYDIPEVSFDYEEYHIQVIDDENYDYGHYFGMIGYSDSLQEICYLYYYNYDSIIIETIPGGIQKFMEIYFRFENEDR